MKYTAASPEDIEEIPTIHRLVQGDARDLSFIPDSSIHLVVTSPPYPGIHMLYHRWQVDGRKETDAPYWIAACDDGCGTSFYNFADRRRNAEDRYFEKAERSFAASSWVCWSRSYSERFSAAISGSSG